MYVLLRIIQMGCAFIIDHNPAQHNHVILFKMYINMLMTSTIHTFIDRYNQDLQGTLYFFESLFFLISF